MTGNFLWCNKVFWACKINFTWAETRLVFFRGRSGAISCRSNRLTSSVKWTVTYRMRWLEEAQKRSCNEWVKCKKGPSSRMFGEFCRTASQTVVWLFCFLFLVFNLGWHSLHHCNAVSQLSSSSSRVPASWLCIVMHLHLFLFECLLPLSLA